MMRPLRPMDSNLLMGASQAALRSPSNASSRARIRTDPMPLTKLKPIQYAFGSIDAVPLFPFGRRYPHLPPFEIDVQDKFVHSREEDFIARRGLHHVHIIGACFDNFL